MQEIQQSRRLATLTAEAACKCKVLGLNGDALGVDSREVRIFEERDEISLRGLLQSHDCGRLEAEVGLYNERL